MTLNIKKQLYHWLCSSFVQQLLYIQGGDQLAETYH